MNRSPLSALLILFALASAPSAGAASRSVREQVDAIEADLRALVERVQALEDRNVALVARIEETRGAMALDSPERRTPADLDARLDSLETDLRVLFENQNETMQRMSVLTDKLDALFRQRAREAAAPPPVAVVPGEPLPGDLPTETLDAPGQPSDTPVVSEPSQTLGTLPVDGTSSRASQSAALVDPEELYQTARSDFGRGSYDMAQSGFQEFVDRFPESELADNALYWVGECQYASGRYEESLATFESVSQRYPGADKAPDAEYKRALALLELNRTADGIIALQHVKDDHPGTPAGRLARTKLQSLGLM